MKSQNNMMTVHKKRQRMSWFFEKRKKKKWLFSQGEKASLFSRQLTENIQPL